MSGLSKYRLNADGISDLNCVAPMAHAQTACCMGFKSLLSSVGFFLHQLTVKIITPYFNRPILLSPVGQCKVPNIGECNSGKRHKTPHKLQLCLGGGQGLTMIGALCKLKETRLSLTPQLRHKVIQSDKFYPVLMDKKKQHLYITHPYIFIRSYKLLIFIFS